MTYAGRPPQFPESALPRPYVAGHPDWTELHLLAWRLAYDHILHRDDTPTPWYMDEGMRPDQIWMWDSCLMAIFCRYLPDLYPGIETLDNFYGYQRADGYISMSYKLPEGSDTFGTRVNPPLLAWTEWLHYQTSGRADRFPVVLPKLVRYFEWIRANRTRPSGAYWYASPGSGGMDNAPRASNIEWEGGMLGWVDLTAQQAFSAMYIAKIARVVGDAELAARYEQEHAALKQMLNEKFWCMRSRFYHDIYSDGLWLSTKTVAAFWTLLAHVPDAPRAECLVDHLCDPHEFKRPHMVPTLSADDPNYKDHGQYWRGGVWPPTNYMICRGLKENRYPILAGDIAANHVEMMCRTFREIEPHTIWECYAPEWVGASRNAPGNATVRPDFVGWGGLGPIAMFYECILGIDLDVPNRRLYWTVGRAEEHGVERFPFGDGRVSLHCAARKRPPEPPTVTMEADCDLTVVVCVPGVNVPIAQETAVELKAGEKVTRRISIERDGCIKDEK